jgi:sugar/nucleoside kinase (ribokinase family)
MGALKVKRGSKRAKRRVNKSRLSLSFDVVCVGRPAKDTIISGEVFNPVCSHGACYEHIPLGSKIPVDNLKNLYGGNALNASVTFSRQNLNCGILAQLGTDSISFDVLNILKSENISDNLIFVDDSVEVAQSTIIISTNGERSILAYPGSEVSARELLNNLEKVETRWIYLSSTNSLELLEGVVKYAELNQVRVALNPGGIELENLDLLKSILPSIEVLILNKQEASLLFGNLDSPGLARAGAEYSKTCIVTDGPNGSFAFDGSVDYYQGISEDVQIVDRNGAGDAFASGVISSLAWGNNLKEALELGAKNSTSVVQHFGAHQGILRKD